VTDSEHRHVAMRSLAAASAVVAGCEVYLVSRPAAPHRPAEVPGGRIGRPVGGRIATDEQVRAAHALGGSEADIGARLGMTRGGAHHRLAKLGLSTGNTFPPWHGLRSKETSR
jgi:hypothetical protein